MKPLKFPLLADENIHPGVISALASAGKDVRSVRDEGLAGSSDIEIIRHALRTGRVVVTHDSDFGAMAVYGSEPYLASCI